MAMDGATIHKLLGTADNSGEPEPLVNKQSTVLGVVISFAVLSWLCVAYRIHVRAKVVQSMGWDDVFVMLSSFGMGKHIYYLSADQVQNYLRTFYVANASYVLSTAFIKISLLFQYLRIFDQPSFSRRLCIFTIIFTSLWSLTYSFLGWVPCLPVRAYWDWSVPATRWAYGSLTPEIFSATYESHSAINVALDLLVLAIPIPIYFETNVPFKSKLGLLALLAIGIALESVELDDDVGAEEGRRSRVGSEASLRQENRGGEGLYRDEFIANQVDPFRKSKSVVTEVKAGEGEDGGWWQK
ncbi:hypothetical protein ColKHC_09331 [Colletotrichum higginsianum]|nr:hypothetical protein ColKHC_09331 [Colletotrichum higginsianum]